MTHRKEKALQALLVSPTQAAAASAAGIGESTLRGYLKDPEFMERYRAGQAAMIEAAAQQLQGTVTIAIDKLRAILEDDEASSTAQISAIRTALEYGLRYREFSTILQELEGADVL